MKFIPQNIFDKHTNCEIYVDLFPRDKKGNLVTQHNASLRCKTCNKWLKWLTLKEVALLEEYVESTNE